MSVACEHALCLPSSRSTKGLFTGYYECSATVDYLDYLVRLTAISIAYACLLQFFSVMLFYGRVLVDTILACVKFPSSFPFECLPRKQDYPKCLTLVLSIPGAANT